MLSRLGVCFMAGYVDATRGKTRDLPITPKLKQLLLSAADDVGVDTVRVISGGQCGKGICKKRTGSTRHDGGNAADLQLLVGGKKMRFDDPEDRKVFEAFVIAAAEAGATGLGAGKHYMGVETIHVGFGSRKTWGAGGKSVNAPAWLIEAAKTGWKKQGLMSAEIDLALLFDDEEEVEEDQVEEVDHDCLADYEIPEEDLTADADLPKPVSFAANEFAATTSGAATWLERVLFDAGLKVAPVEGWKERSRGSLSAQGVICHHTATSKPGNMPSLKTLINGRRKKDGSWLNGPLAQLGLARDGTYYLVAAGRANHAGEGRWKDVTGNRHFIGIEAENSGRLNDPWPEVQMDAYRRGVAAILRHLQLDVEMCAGHKEYAPGRKPDPTFDMDEFREEVAKLL